MYFKLFLAVQTLVFVFFGIATITVFIKVKAKNISKKYLYPSFAAGVLLIYFFFGQLVPNYSDLKYLRNSEFSTYKGVCECAVKGAGNEVKFGGEFYKYNPYDFKPSQGEEYIIYYLPNSKFIIEYKNV